MNTMVGTSVVLVRWPADEAHVEQLRLDGVPRLLLVGEGEMPPNDPDPLQDWIRLPASDIDLHARVSVLDRRRAPMDQRPTLTGDGRITYAGQWVGVGVIAERILTPLVESFGEVVSTSELIQCGWPEGSPSESAPRLHIRRIRQLITPMGLDLKVVRERGYVLQRREVQDAEAGVGVAWNRRNAMTAQIDSTTPNGHAPLRNP